MQIISKIQDQFVTPLKQLLEDHGVQDCDKRLAQALTMIRPAQNMNFGDYQANFAMSLSGVLKKKSVEIANQVVALADLTSICQTVEVAGPGFINMTLKDSFLLAEAKIAQTEDNLGISAPRGKQKVVVDFSSPNVAKPMHVGHIRSTVIGDALAKVYKFLGHEVITDNHLGDWGTQFGMIIYGYRNFGDPKAYQEAPVAELSRIYRLVRQLMDILEKTKSLPKLQTEAKVLATELQAAKVHLESVGDSKEKKTIKAAKQAVATLVKKAVANAEGLENCKKTLAATKADADLQALLGKHQDIATAVTNETSKLHAGDLENLKLWKEILPHCHDEIDRVYSRLGIKFDHQHGESFYHDRLTPLVEQMIESGLASQSEGATCVFVDDFDAPMIVKKSDGAFLYATTDLATIEYRMTNWKPDAMLYVVDHRQHEHFEKLFAVADKMGYQDVLKAHVSFGTVMGPDGKPYKTRSGDTVGLEGLINEAVAKAFEVVSDLDDKKKDPDGNKTPEFDQETRKSISEVVGVGALKYGDLSQNRSSDYAFDFNTMVSLEGDTATYKQYAYARVNGIAEKIGTSVSEIRQSTPTILISNDAERVLLLSLLRFQDALEEVLVDFRPNLLCTYLHELAKVFSTFYNRDDCKVKGAEPKLQQSRLALCELFSRTTKIGLSLLGIGVVEKM